MIALSIALIALRGAGTLWAEEGSYYRALDTGRTALERTARSAEFGTVRLLHELDLTLSGVEQVIDAAPPRISLRDPSLRNALGQLNARTGVASNLLVVDLNGRVVNRAKAASGDEAPDGLFGARHPAGSEGLFLGAAERTRPGSGWSIILGRPLMRGGANVGMIAAKVPMSAFVKLYDAISPPDGTRIELLRDNGAVIADRPGRTAIFGAAPISAGANPAAIPQPGLIETREKASGGSVIKAFRRVAEYPVAVSASRAKDDILQQWRRECVGQAIEFGLFALAITGLAWVATRALRRRQFAIIFQRRSEVRLKRQGFLLQSTLESIGEGLSVFDKHGRLIARNRRFCELLELPPDLPMHALLRDILAVQAARGDFGDTLSPQAEVALRLEKFFRDVPIIKDRLAAGGRILQIRRRSMPGGAVVSIYSDITELKASEHKLLEARSQAELANHSKSEFLANMSHELRTPLNAIIGFTEIIAQELFGPIVNEKYLEYVKDVHSSSLHLLSIINDVLDMSKIEAGKLELQKEAVTLQSVITDATRIVHERASTRGIEFITGGSVDPVVVWADERSIKQVLLNLLSNAIKFSNEGGKIRVGVRAEPPDWAVIEVEDHGIGMNEDEQERALQPFGQAKPATTRSYGGTGLGLPITKGLIDAHGGSLTISSRPSAGTTVCLRLPIGITGPTSME
ncbi:MAG: sensor histidine kinase [Stellaceae bacterium]